MAFGILMLASVSRFMANGWVYSLYVKPRFYFPFYGFEWVKPLGENGMYFLFVLMAVTALFIAMGFAYRISALLFFLAFTYVELIDKTNYLNHYYFISIAAFLLFLLPAHRYFSVDAFLFPRLRATHAPNYFLLVIKLQVFLVYFFAGLAKINSDWLLEAMPLRIWLPAHSEMFLIGPLLAQTWVAFAFSWFACAYDLLIPFFLFIPKYVKKAYFFVIVFHLATSLFFNIGMFPYIMIALTCIFFSEKFHLRVTWRISNFLQKLRFKTAGNPGRKIYSPAKPVLAFLVLIFCAHFTIQLFLPVRFLLYPGKLFWTEQGYRFSWRVMLMEKAGTAFFYVRDRKTGRETEISNCDYLTSTQEKMMATQPDMLIDYAHLLKSEYEKKGMKDPLIRVEAYVTLNGRPSRLMTDPAADLGKEEDGFMNKKWILPFTEEKK